MTKKISIFLLTVLLLLPIGLMSQAAETPTFAITNATGYAGNEVTVDIECSGNPGIGSWQLIVNYDKTYLELKSVNTNDSVFKENGITQTSKDINDYPYHMAWAYGQENVKANGKVATLTFNIKSNAAPGNYTINVDEFTAYTIDFQKTAFTLQDGTITVKEKETSSNTSSNATSSTTSSNSSSNATSSTTSSNTSSNATSSNATSSNATSSTTSSNTSSNATSSTTSSSSSSNATSSTTSSNSSSNATSSTTSSNTSSNATSSNATSSNATSSNATSSNATSSTTSSNTSSNATSSTTSSNSSSNATSSTTSSNSSSNSSSSGSTGGTTNNNNNIKNAGGTTTAGTNNTTTASQTGKSVTTGDISGTAITLSAFLFCIAIMAITAFIKKAEDN